MHWLNIFIKYSSKAYKVLFTNLMSNTIHKVCMSSPYIITKSKIEGTRWVSTLLKILSFYFLSYSIYNSTHWSSHTHTAQFYLWNWNVLQKAMQTIQVDCNQYLQLNLNFNPPQQVVSAGVQNYLVLSLQKTAIFCLVWFCLHINKVSLGHCWQASHTAGEWRQNTCFQCVCGLM